MPTPPAPPAPAPAHDDGGAPATADARVQQPKLPAPAAGTTAAPDGGVDATVPDVGSPEAALVRAPAAGEIRIVEVLANPAGQDTGREWIELMSWSSDPLDLSQLHVAGTALDAAAPAGIIAPGARMLLGQLPDGSKNGGAPVAVAYGTRLALNNDAEELRICIGACADGVVIDRVGWKTLATAYEAHALVFDYDANLTCPATQPFGTAGDFGTPGEANDGCSAPDAGF